MCECSASPPSNCTTRCFPFGSTDSTRRPFSRPIDAGRASVTTLPAIWRRRAAAVRQIVSPSGKDGSPLGPEDDALRRRAEPGFAQQTFEWRTLDWGAVDALDLQLVYPRGNRRQRLQVGRLHVANGEQRAATPLQVQPQLATIEDDVGARGPRHP